MRKRKSIMFDDDDIPEWGAIFMSNRATKRECFEQGLFGLPSSFASFVRNVKSGMILFLFEFERRELHGVFMASSDGAMDIVPNAFTSSRKQFPAQVRFNDFWRCSPLSECEFRDAIRDNYWSAKKFKFGLNKDQVRRLLSLFRLRNLEDQLPRTGFSHGRLMMPSGHNLDTVEIATPNHNYASSNNLVEKHGSGDVAPISDEFMEASFEKVRQSSSDEKNIPQDVMKNNFGVENDPFVWNDNVNEISGRARRSSLVSREFVGASFDRIRPSSSGRKFMPQDMMENDFGADNMVCDLPKPTRCHVGEPRDSDINNAMSQAASCSLSSLGYRANAWSDVRLANSYHYPELSRSGVNPSVYPIKSTLEAGDMVSDRLKLMHYHSVEPPAFGVNRSSFQEAPISISPLPFDANVPRTNYNSKATTGVNYSSDLALESDGVDVYTSYANRNTLPRQDLYEYSRPLADMPKLPDADTNDGKEMISNNERWTQLSDVRFTSSAAMQAECGFAGRENGGQAFFSVKEDENIPFEYPVESQDAFDNILSQYVENEAPNGDSSMPINGQGCLQNFDYAEIQNAYNNKCSSTFHVDESNQISKRIYFGNHKKSSSVFSRLGFASDMDVQESGSHHFGGGKNMDTRAGITMAILPHSCTQLVKVTSTEKYTNEELHINRKRKCKRKLKRGTEKSVSKKHKMYTGNISAVEEMNMDHDIEEEPSSESMRASENLEMPALNAGIVIGKHAAPFIDFKRRRKSLKVEDIKKSRDCERSEVLLSGLGKRRILIRPKFDTETSNGRAIDGETCNKLVPSSQEFSVENDTPGNNCETRVLLSGECGRRKLKRLTLGNKKASNCSGIDADTSNNLSHIEDAANDTLHGESESQNKKAYNVSVQNVDIRNDEICLHGDRIGNNLTTNSSCHLILDSDRKKNLQACIDGKEEELLQLSLETGAMNKRTSSQILKSLLPSEKQESKLPLDEDGGFLQLSLGRRHIATSDAANCSYTQEFMKEEVRDGVDGNRQTSLGEVGVQKNLEYAQLNSDAAEKKEEYKALVGPPL